MRQFFILGLALWVSSASLAWADQNDPALDALFEQLRYGADDIAAVQAEIEARWITAPEVSTQILVTRLVEAIEMDDRPVADVLASHVTGLAPSYAEGWMLRGHVASMRDDLAAAELAYSRALALEPRHFRALEALGDLAYSAGRRDEAYSFYRQALDVHPNLAGVREKVDQLRFETGSQEI